MPPRRRHAPRRQDRRQGYLPRVTYRGEALRRARDNQMFGDGDNRIRNVENVRSAAIQDFIMNTLTTREVVDLTEDINNGRRTGYLPCRPATVAAVKIARSNFKVIQALKRRMLALENAAAQCAPQEEEVDDIEDDPIEDDEFGFDEF